MLSTNQGRHNKNENIYVHSCFYKVRQSIENIQLNFLFAPDGYGKTSVLTYCFEYFEKISDDICCIWLDKTNFDLKQGSSSLLTALSHFFNHQLEQDSTIEKILQRYTSGQCYIFIDDYEKIECTSFNNEIDALLDIKKVNWHVIIASRIFPKFKISHLELNQKIKIFNSSSLSFNCFEVSEYLDTNISNSQLEFIFNKTQGWPYAISICKDLLNNKENVRKLFELSGEDYAFSQLFKEQILDNLDSDMQEFLVGFSTLEMANAELCNYALKFTDSKFRLKQLYHSGAFIENIDRNNREFKVHPLLREFILSQQVDNKSKKILVRASIWSIRNQYYKKSAYYAKLSQDPHIQNLVIDKTSEILVKNLGELPTVINWVKELKDEKYFNWNKIIYWLAWSLAFSYQWEESKQRVNDLRVALQNDQYLNEMDFQFYSAKLDSIEIVLLIFQDKRQISLEKSKSWFKKNKKTDNFDKAVVSCASYLSYRLDVDYDSAQKSIEYALQVIRDTDSIYGEIWVNLLYGLFIFDCGLYNRAQKILERQFYKTIEEIGEDASILPTISQLLSAIYYELNQISKAQEYVEIGYKNIKNHGLVETAFAGISTSYKLQKNWTDTQNLRENLQDIISIYPQRLKILLNYLQVELYLLSNKTEKGASYLNSIDISMEDSTDQCLEVKIYHKYINILVQLNKNNLKLACNLLDEFLYDNQLQNNQFLLSKILILKSFIALKYENNKKEALDRIKHALFLATENGYFSVFIDFEKFSIDSLQLIKSSASTLDENYKNLINELSSYLPLGDENEQIKFNKENFSKRELELLAMLESGLKYKQIADELFISLSTVKWHINNIYIKLGVKNRTGALVVARKYALI
ncbi:response regulator transcription factor [Acinetobacter guillouiae]|uniref:helix-turn-helix transcriptional regulator n=2 Tax=Acinetobacter guillouiae TaxID=106649 RepID=UPI003AF5AFBB